MPWTFAHPAAVVPLYRLCPVRLNFAALVIGSLAPDLGYHLRWPELARFAHTAAGGLWVCLPAGLALLTLLSILRAPLWFLLPQPHRRAIEPALEQLAIGRPTALLSAGASVVLGAWTHVAWDAVTHRFGWVVVRLPALQEALPLAGGIPVYSLLQILSSVTGIAVLLVAYWLWLRSRLGGQVVFSPSQDDRLRHVLIVCAMAVGLATGIASGLDAMSAVKGLRSLNHFAFRLAVDGMGAFIVAIGACALLHYRYARRA